VRYLIDGHNLIGQSPGLRLEDPDDEAQLAARLRAFLLRTRSSATVYFDRGDPGAGDPAPAAGLTVRFVPRPRTADQAILHHLARLGGDASQWTVVSSDGEVQRAARRAGARRISSRDFAHQLQTALTAQETPEKPEAPSSSDDLADWERLFRRSR
jgi:predicted RNA-binding protein with PIN domain